MNLSDIQKLHRKYWKVFAITTVLISSIVFWIQFTDPHIDEIKKFLLSKEDVCSNLGTIEKLSLKKSRILFRAGEHGRAQEPDRKIYTFIATGTKGRDRVRVNVKITETDQIGEIKVEC